MLTKDAYFSVPFELPFIMGIFWNNPHIYTFIMAMCVLQNGILHPYNDTGTISCWNATKQGHDPVFKWTQNTYDVSLCNCVKYNWYNEA